MPKDLLVKEAHRMARLAIVNKEEWEMMLKYMGRVLGSLCLRK
jgi:hypothetical protein